MKWFIGAILVVIAAVSAENDHCKYYKSFILQYITKMFARISIFIRSGMFGHADISQYDNCTRSSGRQIDYSSPVLSQFQ